MDSVFFDKLIKPQISICGGNNIMSSFCINLNIHYSAPKKIWDRIEKIYAEMPLEEWNEWLQLFKDKATVVLGYSIGEPEDGYDFKYWE